MGPERVDPIIQNAPLEAEGSSHGSGLDVPRSDALERNGTPVAVYNYTYDLTEKLLSGDGVGKRIQGCRTVYEFVATLERPRRILVMVTAGGVVDDVIAHLRAH
ncbi:MAG: NAD(P)-binding domain-containing protein, partial [Longimicrobiales bacterium]